MPDRLDSMRVFVDVSERKSFSAVAAERGISPQMVAKHIEALEARLGIRLLHRTTRRQSLTEHGRLYRDRCKAILADIDDAEAQASEAHATLRGLLRINAPVMYGAYALVPVVTAFMRRHPEIRCDLALSDGFVDPVEDGYDAVFRIGPVDEHSAVAAFSLRPYRLIACAAPAYIAAHGLPETPEALTGHECIGFDYRNVSQRGEWHFAKGGRIVQVPIESRLSVSDWKAMHRAALDGFGIALALEVAVGDDLEAGRLVRLLPKYDAATRPMHMLCARDPRRTARAQAFLDWAKEALGN